MRKQRSCLEKEIMQGTMPGARRRGRPRTTWMDNINTWTGLPVEESIRMTEDRDKWRKYENRHGRTVARDHAHPPYSVHPYAAVLYLRPLPAWVCMSLRLPMFPIFLLYFYKRRNCEMRDAYTGECQWIGSCACWSVRWRRRPNTALHRMHTACPIPSVDDPYWSGDPPCTTGNIRQTRSIASCTNCSH